MKKFILLIFGWLAVGMINLAHADDYVLDQNPKYYPDRAEFEGELSEPVKDPKVCGLYLQNLRYFARRNLPMSCGQPVAPTLTNKIKPVEWENLDPEKYPELFKEVNAKMFPPARESEKESYLSEATLSSRREQVRKGVMVFRRAKLELMGHVVLPSTYAPTEKAIAFQIVQFGFNVSDPANPNTRMRCKQNTGRVLPGFNEDQLQFFIASENLHEFFGEMSDGQLGYQYYFNLWLINGKPYGEQYDDKGTVLLSEIRSDMFVRACLFHYTKSLKRDN